MKPSHKEAEQIVLKYMEDRYGIPFTISGSGGQDTFDHAIHEVYLRSDAYPEAHITAVYYFDDGEIRDNLMGIILETDIVALMESTVQEIYGENNVEISWELAYIYGSVEKRMPLDTTAEQYLTEPYGIPTAIIYTTAELSTRDADAIALLKLLKSKQLHFDISRIVYVRPQDLELIRSQINRERDYIINYFRRKEASTLREGLEHFPISQSLFLFNCRNWKVITSEVSVRPDDEWVEIEDVTAFGWDDDWMVNP